MSSPMSPRLPRPTVRPWAGPASRVGRATFFGLMGGVMPMLLWLSGPDKISAPKAPPPGVSSPRLLPLPVFQPGERLEYRVHYGFISAGEAVLAINPRYWEVGQRACYRIEVQGRSSSAFDRFVKIRNVWGSYMDTAQYKPVMSYRDIQENRYRLREEVRFDYPRHLAHVDRRQSRDTSFAIPDPVQDIVSGYYFLRRVDFNPYRPGDVITMDAFFDNELYRFSVKFVGRETVKTRFGKVRALVIAPIMPKNGLFAGENSIRLYMSDDANRIPLRVRAELFVGAVELDLRAYSGIRAPLVAM